MDTCKVAWKGPQETIDKPEQISLNFHDSVDGSEILRSPVEVGSLSHYLQGLIHAKCCNIFSINSYTLENSNKIP